MKEVTLSPQEKNSRFRKIVTLPELLFSEMTKNPSYQLTITPKPFWRLSLPYQKIHLGNSFSFVISRLVSFRFVSLFVSFRKLVSAITFHARKRYHQVTLYCIVYSIVTEYDQQCTIRVFVDVPSLPFYLGGGGDGMATHRLRCILSIA